MAKKGTDFKEYLDENLRDPEFAAMFLSNAIEEGDEAFLAGALADVVRIHGVAKVASESGIARQALYKMLSAEGNPSYKNIVKILDVLGLEVVFQNKKSS